MKSGYFAAIDSCCVKTVANRYIYAAYHNKHYSDELSAVFTSTTLNDLEPPKRVLIGFLQFSAVVHISRVNCAEIAGDRSEQTPYGIFSIERTF